MFFFLLVFCLPCPNIFFFLFSLVKNLSSHHKKKDILLARKLTQITYFRGNIRLIFHLKYLIYEEMNSNKNNSVKNKLFSCSVLGLGITLLLEIPSLRSRHEQQVDLGLADFGRWSGQGEPWLLICQAKSGLGIKNAVCLGLQIRSGQANSRSVKFGRFSLFSFFFYF